MVGSTDLRKGSDRIRPVLDAFVKRHGPCRCIIVSRATDDQKRDFRLLPPFDDGLQVEWRSGISPDALMQLYSHADVLLHLARYESFGLPLIEAAAAGTPVVATRVGIAPELMEGELERFLVDGDDPDAVVHALAEVGVKRDEIGLQMRLRYGKKYTCESMIRNCLANFT